MKTDDTIIIAVILALLLFRKKQTSPVPTGGASTTPNPQQTPDGTGQFEPGGGEFGGAGAGGSWEETPLPDPDLGVPVFTPDQTADGKARWPVLPDDPRLLHPELCDGVDGPYLVCPIEAFKL